MRLRALGLGAVLFAALTTSVSAEHLSPDAALNRLMGGEQLSTLGLKSAVKPTLVYSAKADKATDPGCYVFSRGDNGGFIVVCAEDELPLLLGYSDSGTFDYESSAPAFKWWIEDYARQIEYYRANSDGAVPGDETIKMAKQPIAPILGKTQWNQGAPYNYMCPKDNSGPSVTGCVATAMAQVIRRWEYPERGTGVYTFDTRTYDNGKVTDEKYGELEFDYGSTEFKWDKMLDNYEKELPPNTNNENTDAVATLMLGCGIGVRMGYSSSGSGAYSNGVARALVENFGYDPGARLCIRDHYSKTAWENLIYLEVEAGRPVLISGATQDGKSAHEFVCDGADGKGCYHINWGWGGSSDGYFVLTALDPAKQGIGGSSSGAGFSAGGDALIGIQPPTGRTPRYYLPVTIGTSFYGEGAAGNDNYYFAWRGFLTVQTQVGNVDKGEGASFTLGVRVCDKNGDSQNFASNWEVKNLRASWGWGDNKMSVNIPQGALEPGQYSVFPAFRYPDGTWQDISLPYDKQSYCKMMVYDDGSIRFTSPVGEKLADLVFTGFEAKSPFALDNNGESVAEITIENTGDKAYTGLIGFKLLAPDGTDLGDAGEKMEVSIEPGSSITMPHSFNIDVTPGVGKYYVSLVDKLGRQLLGERTIDVLASSGINEVETRDITVKNAGGDILVSGAPEGVDIAVYDMKGVQVKAVKSTGDDILISVARNNAYIVKVGGKSFKILL